MHHHAAAGNRVGAGCNSQQIGLPAAARGTPGVSAQVRHVAGMPVGLAVVRVRLAARINEPTGAHGVRRAAVWLLVHMETVFRIGLQAADLCGDQDLLSALLELRLATGSVAGSRLELGAGNGPGTCATVEHCAAGERERSDCEDCRHAAESLVHWVSLGLVIEDVRSDAASLVGPMAVQPLSTRVQTPVQARRAGDHHFGAAARSRSWESGRSDAAPDLPSTVSRAILGRPLAQEHGRRVRQTA